MDIPEKASLCERSKYDCNNIRGTGGNTKIPMSVAEENLLCYQDDIHRDENTLVHEFGHAVINFGLGVLSGREQTAASLRSHYESALLTGKWQGKYASVNVHEYWAVGTQIWFDATKNRILGFGLGLNTRAQLTEYDPALASILSEVFKGNDWRYECPTVQPAA